MLNDITTTTAGRETACELVLNGLDSLRQGLIMYHELGLTTKEIYADLKAAGWDKSLRVLQRHQTELRKEGLIAPAKTGVQTAESYAARACQNLHAPVENSTPQPVAPVTTEITPPNYEPKPILVAAELVEEDEFRVECRDSDEAERDYERCLEHIDAIIALTKKYFHSGWDKRKWYELAGECRTIEACCTNHCGSNFGAGSQRISG